MPDETMSFWEREGLNFQEERQILKNENIDPNDRAALQKHLQNRLGTDVDDDDLDEYIELLNNDTDAPYEDDVEDMMDRDPYFKRD